MTLCSQCKHHKVIYLSKIIGTPNYFINQIELVRIQYFVLFKNTFNTLYLHVSRLRIGLKIHEYDLFNFWFDDSS